MSRLHRRKPGRCMMALTALMATTGLALATAPAQAAPLPAPPLDPAAMAAQVAPAVVNVDTQMGYQSATGAGTGIVIDPGGLVLTNNHVVAGATGIQAHSIGTGQTYDVDVLGFDRSHDIAVLQLRGAFNLPTANIGNSSLVGIGEPVVAMGNAGGQGGAPSAVPGRITSLNESVSASDALTGNSENLTNLIKADTPIRPGDSGGPLVNGAGQVIGVNTAASENFQFGGDGYAVPINQAMAIAGQIRSGVSSPTVHIGPTAFLGVGVADGGGGAEVLQVISGTPAADAGVAEHDVITRANGRPVNSATDLTDVLDQQHPGDTVTLDLRGPVAGERTVTVTLAPGPVG